jgi:hypothetical protein
VIFYHGTSSTFEASIREHGLRKNRGKRWNALATTEDGKPLAALEFPGAVWISQDFGLACEYARLKALILCQKRGALFTYRASTSDLTGIRSTRMRKVSRVYDPDAEPIVFRIELGDDEKRIPACPLTHRLLRAIPPEALTLIRLPHEMTITW